jgi:fido (protein-threonine AMPylation protein)
LVQPLPSCQEQRVKEFLTHYTSIIQAHAEVLEGLFALIKSERTLSTSYIKELHAALLRYQDTTTAYDQFGNPVEITIQKGAYKLQPNSPKCEDGSIHEYCPPEHVAAEMDRLVALHAEHSEKRLPPVVQAAWLHHAFTQIHPFQDGNGRVARTIATLVLLKAGLFPLIVDREDKRYIDSLEAADAGNLGPLVQFFSTIQKRYLTKAIGLAVDVRPASNVEEAVRLTSDMLVNLGRIIPKEWLAAQNSAGDLLNHALGRLNHVTGLLRDQLSTVDSTFTFVTVVLDRPPREALETIAHKLLYDPDFNQYSKGVQLTLKTSKSASKMVIFFQGAGSSYRGILVVSGFFQEGENQPVPLSDDVFRISYEENLPELRKRFAPWMEACLVRGTALWRRTLL